MDLDEEEHYKKSLYTIERLINNVDENSPELIEFLDASDFVELYEKKYFPLPKANFWDKIRFWFQYDLVGIIYKFRK